MAAIETTGKRIQEQKETVQEFTSEGDERIMASINSCNSGLDSGRSEALLRVEASS